MTNKAIHIIGGGTLSWVRPHLALTAPAYGTTARTLTAICKSHPGNRGMDVFTHLTRMADSSSPIEDHQDLSELVQMLVKDPLTKIIFMNAAVVDYAGEIEAEGKPLTGKFGDRLDSSKPHVLNLTPLPKLLGMVRRGEGGMPMRKDIFLVAFKTTCGASAVEQYNEGLALLKRSSANLVFANDIHSHLNMVITPEEASYHVTHKRDEALKGLVDMALLRSHLTFTRSTVVAGEPVAWNSNLIPRSLRTVVEHCIVRGAYKRVNGVTAGHFATKIGPTTFLTSRRKTDFNEMPNVGLVKVETDGADSVIAYGSRPSVGGQSQRILFGDHPEYNCVVHFHCPIKRDSKVPTVSQREYECGSHECGKNTSNGLTKFGPLAAVYLDNHGPNIVFDAGIDPQIVIDFIEANFNLDGKTGGYQITTAAVAHA